jgi:hypothetical protein
MPGRFENASTSTASGTPDIPLWLRFLYHNHNFRCEFNEPCYWKNVVARLMSKYCHSGVDANCGQLKSWQPGSESFCFGLFSFHIRLLGFPVARQEMTGTRKKNSASLFMLYLFELPYFYLSCLFYLNLSIVFRLEGIRMDRILICLCLSGRKSSLAKTHWTNNNFFFTRTEWQISLLIEKSLII